MFLSCLGEGDIGWLEDGCWLSLVCFLEINCSVMIAASDFLIDSKVKCFSEWIGASDCVP